MNSFQVAELIFLLHKYGAATTLAEIAADADIYASPGPKVTPRSGGNKYNSQAEIALIGLSRRKFNSTRIPLEVSAVLLQILRTLSGSEIGSPIGLIRSVQSLLGQRNTAFLPWDATTWPEFAALARRLAKCLVKDDHRLPERNSAIDILNSWADSLEHTIAAKAKEQTNPAVEPTSKTITGRTAKKKAERRRSKDER